MFVEVEVAAQHVLDEVKFVVKNVEEKEWKDAEDVEEEVVVVFAMGRGFLWGINVQNAEVVEYAKIVKVAALMNAIRVMVAASNHAILVAVLVIAGNVEVRGQ